MNVYVWRHNRKFHSWSMITEPCINEHAYTDAVAVVAAEHKEQAIKILCEQDEGWIAGELERLEPKVYSLDQAEIIFTNVCGS